MGFAIGLRAQGARSLVHFLVLVSACAAICLGLVGCGSSNDDEATGPEPSITLSTSTVTLADSREDAQQPEAKSVKVQAVGNRVAGVSVVADPKQPAAPWVTATVQGVASPYEVSVAVGSDAPVGDNTAYLLVRSTDASGAELASAPLTVQYKVIASLRADTAPLEFSGVNGADAPAAQTFKVYGDLAWTATASNPWIHLDATSGSGPATITVSVDDATLAAGGYEGAVVLASADGQTVTVPVKFSLTVTALTVSTTSLTLGGENGRDATARTLSLSLGTEGNAYAWHLEDVPDWLVASTRSGTVDDTPQTISFSPDVGVAPAGTTTATVAVVAQVNGDVMRQNVSVQLKLDTRRLYLSEYGVGLTSTPTWSRLRHTVRVQDNFNLSTAWTASSDKPWLTVTARGKAGGTLALAADPSSLAVGTLTFATVTVSSTEPGAANSVKLKVGMWKAAASPNTIKTTTNDYLRLASDPIRPYVYVGISPSTIDVFNAYTGVKVHSISIIDGFADEMAVSGDGQHLYAADSAKKVVHVVNLGSFRETGVIKTPRLVRGQELVVPRVMGEELLVLGDLGVYRTSDGRELSAGDGIAPEAYVLTASNDGSKLFSILKYLSPADSRVHSLDYSSIGGGTSFVKLTTAQQIPIAGTVDALFSADNNTLYIADSAAGEISGYNATDLAGASSRLPPIPIYGRTTNVDVGSDGSIVGGYDWTTVMLYTAAGALSKQLRIGGDFDPGTRARTLKFTADALMLVTLTTDLKLMFIPVGP